MLLRVVLALTYVWYKEKGKQTLPSNNNNSKSVDERLALVKDEIHQVIQECPISVSTLLDICISIRNFKFSTVQRLQSDFEAKVGKKFEDRQIFVCRFLNKEICKIVADKIIMYMYFSIVIKLILKDL